jgi:hypothetical protein
MKNISLRNLLFAAAISLLIIYAAWWGRMIATPEERNGADFIAFYSAGRAAQIYGLSHVYNMEYQQSIQEKVVGFQLADGQVLLYNHMPFLVPILALVVQAHYAGSFLQWVLILLVIYIAGVLFFLRALSIGGQNQNFLLLFIATITFFPLFISLWQGQDTAFLFLGVIFWCIGILKKDDWLIGAGLALTTVRPHICITLAVPLLFKNPGSWWRYLLLPGVLALTSVIILNRQGSIEFYKILMISSEGSWFGMKPAAMFNLLGFLIRIFRFQNSAMISSLGWLIYLAGVIMVCFLWKYAKRVNGILLGSTILIAIITAPHLHLHDLTLLIFPILFIMEARSIISANPQWILLPIGISFFLLLGILVEEVYFILPYLVFVLLTWLLLSDRQKDPLPEIST